MLGSSSVQCPSPRDSPGRIVPSVGLSMLPVTQRGGRGLQGSGRHRARAEQTRGSSRRRVYRPELRGKRRRLPRARLPERGHLCGRREHLQLPLPARVDRHVHGARAQREGGAAGSEGPRQPAGPWGPVQPGPGRPCAGARSPGEASRLGRTQGCWPVARRPCPRARRLEAATGRRGPRRSSVRSAGRQKSPLAPQVRGKTRSAGRGWRSVPGKASRWRRPPYPVG